MNWADALQTIQTGAKIRLSTVLDQGDDTEIRPLGHKMLQDLTERWKAKHNDGEDPDEEVEATLEQVSALAYRVKSGATPFVDFGVWRPHGAKFGRILKFGAWFQNPDGSFVRKELSGADSFEEWLRSWRVFVYTFELLDLGTSTRMNRYLEEVRRLASDYPGHWWIIACADLKMRSEGLERIRRKLVREHLDLKRAGLPSDYDPLRPWDIVFREAARDADFWTKHVDRRVMQFSLHQKTQAQITDPGCGALTLVQQQGGGSLKREAAGGAAGGGDSWRRPGKKPRRRGGKGSGKGAGTGADGGTAGQGGGAPAGGAWGSGGTGGGKGGGAANSGKSGFNNDATDPSGRFFRDSAGIQICWDWARRAGGCKEPCPKSRAHICEFCRSGSHRSCEVAKCSVSRGGK